MEVYYVCVYASEKTMKGSVILSSQDLAFIFTVVTLAQTSTAESRRGMD